MLGAVKAGSVDGCIASFSMLDAAEAEGWGMPIFRAYDDANWNSTFKGDLPGVGVYVLKDTLEEKRAEVQKLVDGLVKGTDWVRAASPEEIAELVKADFLPSHSPGRLGQWGRSGSSPPGTSTTPTRRRPMRTSSR